MLVETQEWPGLQIFDEGKEKVVDLLRAVIELGGLPYHRYVLIRYLACKQNNIILNGDIFTITACTIRQVCQSIF